MKAYFLEKHNIELESVYNPPLHLHKIYRKLFSKNNISLPVSEQILPQHISLPIHYFITEEDIDYVSELLARYIKNYAK